MSVVPRRSTALSFGVGAASLVFQALLSLGAGGPRFLSWLHGFERACNNLVQTSNGDVLVPLLASVCPADHSNLAVAIDTAAELSLKPRSLLFSEAATDEHVPSQLDPCGGLVDVLAAGPSPGGRLNLEFVVRNRESHRLTR